MIVDNRLTAAIRSQFHDNIWLSQKRPGVYQVHAPFYHEDGDMVNIYLEDKNSQLRYCDFGKTLMKLSYSFELDTDNKHRIFKQLLNENQVEFDEDKGNIYLETTCDNIGTSLFHFSQVLAKVSRLDVLKREVISGLFFEMLQNFIDSDLQQFSPHFHAIPLPGREEFEVPYVFEIKPHPVYLFGVRGTSQSRLASLSFLEFQKAKLNFRGCVVHDDFDSLPTKDRKRITSAADKQFVSLNDFKENGAEFLKRETA